MFQKIAVFLVIIFCLFVSMPVFAKADSGGGPYLGLEYGGYTGLGKTDVRVTISRVIYVVLGLLGTIAIALVVYAGFKWMTSAGNEEQIGDAKKILYAAVIGLAIILSAYSIVRFVIPQLFKATTNNDYSSIEPGY